MRCRGEQEPKTIPFLPQIRPPLTVGSRGRSSSPQSLRLEYTTKNAIINVCKQKKLSGTTTIVATNHQNQNVFEIQQQPNRERTTEEKGELIRGSRSSQTFTP
jgi:hypothetical protein